MLEFKGVTFQYEDGPGFEFPDFTCASGEHMLLLGDSGTGKTTLLHVLAGLLTPKSGSVVLDGQDMVKMRPADRDVFRGQNIGIVFQTAHFIKSLKVIDNLILPQFFSGKKVDKQKAFEILERLNLGHKSESPTSSLSVGEQQRVSIARALVNEPSLIIADEPTSALDDRNAQEVIQLLEKQAKLSNAALIIVTHDQRLKDHFEKRIEI